MKIRTVLLLLLAGEGLLVGALAVRRPAAPAPGWPEITATDPRVAGVFGTLTRSGLAAALDSLDRVAAADSAVLRGGHQLAHALGREALALSGDASVLAQCRPALGSGCFHGVVEGLLNARGRIDMAELEAMCLKAAGGESPGQAYECVHGLGHGMLGALGLDYALALRYCDALSRRSFQTSCQEGVFMEAIDLELAGRERGAMTSPAGGHDHTGHRAHGDLPAARLTLDPADPYSPCARIPDSYAQSCWLFQGFVILRKTGFDAAAALRTCDAAPESRVPRCYESVGHQLTGLFQRDDAWIVRQCARGRPALAPRCAAGATLALNAMDWSGTRAARFCAAVPAPWTETCYTAAATTLAFYASSGDLVRFCRSIAPPFGAACRRTITARAEPTARPAGTHRPVSAARPAQGGKA